MRILIANDDGIFSPGLVALAVAAIALWILLGVGLQKILGSWRGKRRNQEARS